jgi:hypothetical protein
VLVWQRLLRILCVSERYQGVHSLLRAVGTATAERRRAHGSRRLAIGGRI